MEKRPHEVSLEALLCHGRFVRSLARSLIKDEQLAEDVAQDTWVAYLKKPPAREPLLALPPDLFPSVLFLLLNSRLAILLSGR